MTHKPEDLRAVGSILARWGCRDYQRAALEIADYYKVTVDDLRVEVYETHHACDIAKDDARTDVDELRAELETMRDLLADANDQIAQINGMVGQVFGQAIRREERHYQLNEGWMS